MNSRWMIEIDVWVVKKEGGHIELGGLLMVRILGNMKEGR